MGTSERWARVLSLRDYPRWLANGGLTIVLLRVFEHVFIESPIIRQGTFPMIQVPVFIRGSLFLPAHARPEMLENKYSSI